MDVTDFLSPERLKTFENYTDREEKAIALHNQTLQLGSSLMSMIALLELALRNSANKQLINSFGDAEWLLPSRNSVPLKPNETNAVKSATRQAKRAAYSKISYREKSYLDAFAFPTGVPANMNHKNVVAKRQELFVVSHGQIISQTTFSF
ncbi:MAG: hypothetical protein AAFZ04_16925 [Pseudomonadota bacterium]